MSANIQATGQTPWPISRKIAIFLSSSLGITAIVLAQLAILVIAPTILYGFGIIFLAAAIIVAIQTYKKHSSPSTPTQEVDATESEPESLDQPNNPLQINTFQSSPQSSGRLASSVASLHSYSEESAEEAKKTFIERVDNAYKKNYRNTLKELFRIYLKGNCPNLEEANEIWRQTLKDAVKANRLDVAELMSGCALTYEAFQEGYKADNLEWVKIITQEKCPCLEDQNWSAFFEKALAEGKSEYARCILRAKGIDLSADQFQQLLKIISEATDSFSIVERLSSSSEGSHPKMREILSDYAVMDRLSVMTGSNGIMPSFRLAMEYNFSEWARELLKNVDPRARQNKEWEEIFIDCLIANKFIFGDLILQMKRIVVSASDCERILRNELRSRGNISDVFSKVSGTPVSWEAFVRAVNDNQVDVAQAMSKNGIADANSIKWSVLFRLTLYQQIEVSPHKFEFLGLFLNQKDCHPDAQELVYAFGGAIATSHFDLAKKILGRTFKQGEINEQRLVTLYKDCIETLINRPNPTLEEITTWFELAAISVRHGMWDIALTIYNKFHENFYALSLNREERRILVNITQQVETEIERRIQAEIERKELEEIMKLNRDMGPFTAPSKKPTANAKKTK